MKFLVTGATGFIGGAIVRSLLSHDHEVRALVRNPGSYSQPPGVEVFHGDITDQQATADAARGVDGIFHVAAVYSYWHSDSSHTYRVNVDGTENVMKAARTASVERVVLTSTVATLKWPDSGKLADESSIASLDDLPGHYKRSKLLAEEAALAYKSDSLDVVITNPTAPFGHGDVRPTPTGRIVLEFLNRRFPGYVNTGVNVCDVDDVAEGHVQAYFKGRAGERYILGSENVSLRGIYERLARVTGLQRRPVRVPFAVAMGVAAVDSLVEGRILNREPYVPLEGLRVARHPMYVDCSKAIRELGLPTRPAERALARSARWFVANGYSDAKVHSANSLDSEDEASIGA